MFRYTNWIRLRLMGDVSSGRGAGMSVCGLMGLTDGEGDILSGHKKTSVFAEVFSVFGLSAVAGLVFDDLVTQCPPDTPVGIAKLYQPRRGMFHHLHLLMLLMKRIKPLTDRPA